MHPAALTLAALVLAGCQTVADLIPRNWQNGSLTTEAEREPQSSSTKAGANRFLSERADAQRLDQRRAGKIHGLWDSDILKGGENGRSGHGHINAKRKQPVLQGMADGMAIRQSIEASAARSKIYRGCRYHLGVDGGLIDRQHLADAFGGQARYRQLTLDLRHAPMLMHCQI